MTGNGWCPTEAGVMLWLPSVDVAVDAAEQSLSQLTVKEDDIQSALNADYQDDGSVSPMSPLQDSSQDHIKVEPKDDCLPDGLSSPSTLSAHSDDAVFTPELSSPSTPSSDGPDAFFAQLRSFAESSSSESVVPTTEIFTPLDSQSEYDSGCESDSTDILLHRQSPCDRQKITARRRHEDTTSHHFDRSNQQSQVNYVVRRLDFGKTKTEKSKAKQLPPISQSVEVLSLQQLRSIEADPRRSWDDEEKQLLCIILRWFDATDFTAYTSVFNRITGMSLKSRTVETQFRELCSYGPKASSDWAKVFNNVGFDDPTGRYAAMRSIIEETAHSLNLRLNLRRKENEFNPGSAAKAKSPGTRRKYKDRVRRLAQEKKVKAAQAHLRGAPDRVPRLGGITLAPEFEQEFAYLSDAEETATVPTATHSLHLPKRAHNLGFRVWDTNSRTRFSEDTGFVSEAHAIWNGPFMKPFVPEGQGERALMFLANLHLSMNGNASAFVSVSTSILQCLTKVSSSAMIDPQLALIDLDHPSFNVPYKKLHASDVLRWLKSNNQAQWAKYKGRAEYIIWADVPIEAVVHHFPLSELQSLSDEDRTCADVMNLDLFTLGRRTMAVASQLRDKGTVLSTITAKAMGRIGRVFGLHGENIRINQISTFVSRFIDGFYITSSPTLDIHTRSSIATSFATTLDSRKYYVQDVMGAFDEGMDQGLESIAYYSRGRPASRRKRTA